MYRSDYLLIRQRRGEVPVAVTEGIAQLPNLEEIGVARSTLADAVMT